MPPLLCTGSAGETFLSTVQRAAEAVANAVRPGPAGPGTQGPFPRGDTYQPAVTPAASHILPNSRNLLPGAILGSRGIEQGLPSLGFWVTPLCHVLRQGTGHGCKDKLMLP